MMRSSCAYIIIGVLAILVSSCGQQSRSQSLAEDFMDSYLLTPDKVEDVEFSKLDSTKLVGDSAIKAMRQSLKSSKIFKADIDYPQEKVEGKLLRLRVNYKMEGTEKSATFYFDEGLNGVLGVKND